MGWNNFKQQDIATDNRPFSVKTMEADWAPFKRTSVFTQDAIPQDVPRVKISTHTTTKKNGQKVKRLVVHFNRPSKELFGEYKRVKFGLVKNPLGLLLQVGEEGLAVYDSREYKKGKAYGGSHVGSNVIYAACEELHLEFITNKWVEVAHDTETKRFFIPATVKLQDGDALFE